MSAGSIEIIGSPAIVFAVKAWIEFYIKRPKTTLFITLITLIAIISGIFFLNQIDKQKRENQRLKDFQYETQITQLKETEENIKELLKFVDFQKQNLRETQDSIKNLNEIRNQLKPLVENDKSVVDAIFKAQEQRQYSNIWKERSIGFAFGIVSSMLASFFLYLLKIFINTRTKNEV